MPSVYGIKPRLTTKILKKNNVLFSITCDGDWDINFTATEEEFKELLDDCDYYSFSRGERFSYSSFINFRRDAGNNFYNVYINHHDGEDTIDERRIVVEEDALRKLIQETEKLLDARKQV